MKKISLFAITFLILSFGSVKAQNNNWTEDSYPPMPKTRQNIFSFGINNEKLALHYGGIDGYHFVSGNWQPFQYPLGVVCPHDVKIFKEKIFITGGSKNIAYSYDYENWTIIPGTDTSYFTTLAINEGHIFAFGNRVSNGRAYCLKSSDGISWQSFTIPCNAYATFPASTAEGDTVLVCTGGSPSSWNNSSIYRSNDNGATWFLCDTASFEITSISKKSASIMIAGNYLDASPWYTLYPRTKGQYVLSDNREGSYSSTVYAGTNNYTGLALDVNYPRGRIILNGDTANAWISMESIWGIRTNQSQTECLAWSDNHIFSLDNITDIVKKDLESIKVFPNPTTGLVHIETKSKVVVSNILGVQVGVFDLSNQDKVDLSALSSGVYTISFPEEKNIKSIKIIKQ